MWTDGSGAANASGSASTIAQCICVASLVLHRVRALLLCQQKTGSEQCLFRQKEPRSRNRFKRNWKRDEMSSSPCTPSNMCDLHNTIKLNISRSTTTCQCSKDLLETSFSKHHTDVFLLTGMPAMLPEARAILLEFYKPYNTRLAELLHDPRYLKWNV